MFPKWLILVLKYFNLWGFHFIPFAKFGGKKTCLFINFVNVMLCTWCSLIVLKTFLNQQIQMEFLDAMNFLFLHIAFSISFWLIIFDSYTNRSVQNSFWEIVSQIDKKLNSQTDLNGWTYLIPLFALLITSSSIFVSIMIQDRDIGFATKLMYIFCIYTFDQRIFFYFLHLKVIANQLWKIKTELKGMSEQKLRFNGIPKHLCLVNAVHLQNRFRWIHAYYQLVSEMTENVNFIFGFSHLALLLLYFHSSFTYLNFIYRQTQNKFENFDEG